MQPQTVHDDPSQRPAPSSASTSTNGPRPISSPRSGRPPAKVFCQWAEDFPFLIRSGKKALLDDFPFLVRVSPVQVMSLLVKVRIAPAIGMMLHGLETLA